MKTTSSQRFTFVQFLGILALMALVPNIVSVFTFIAGYAAFSVIATLAMFGAGTLVAMTVMYKIFCPSMMVHHPRDMRIILTDILSLGLIWWAIGYTYPHYDSLVWMITWGFMAFGAAVVSAAAGAWASFVVNK